MTSIRRPDAWSPAAMPGLAEPGAPDPDRLGARGAVPHAAHTAVIGASPLVYWQRGPARARTLVMLHGLGSDHRGLMDLALVLRGVQVVLPDLPGFGHSPPLPGKHTLRQYARVLEGLRRHLGLDRLALLGHSLGAGIALTYAGSYPDAVSDLCLVNPVLDTTGAPIRLAGLLDRLSAALPGPLARALLGNRATVYLQDRAIFTTPDPTVRRRILQQDYLTARLADPRAVHESVRSLHEAPFDRYARDTRARTLLVSGTRDRLAPPASLTGLPWQQPGPELAVVLGAGHLLPVEQPDHVAAIVGRFLGAG